MMKLTRGMRTGLRDIRDENRLSNEELAELIGVSRPSVQRWTTGAVGHVRGEAAKKLKAFLDQHYKPEKDKKTKQGALPLADPQPMNGGIIVVTARYNGSGPDEVASKLMRVLELVAPEVKVTVTHIEDQ